MVHGGSQRQRHSHEFVPRPILILSAPQQRSWRLTGIAKTMQNERRLQRGCTPLFAHRAPLTRKDPPRSLHQ
jgi:hypothetical protein